MDDTVYFSDTETQPARLYIDPHTAQLLRFARWEDVLHQHLARREGVYGETVYDMCRAAISAWKLGRYNDKLSWGDEMVYPSTIIEHFALAVFVEKGR